MMNTLLSHALPSLPSHDLLGQQYHLFEQVGLGGFSQIFRAWDSFNSRPVAIKMLRNNLSEHQRGMAIYQMRNEAHRLAALDHPAIARLYEYNEQLHMLVLPYLDGYSLASALQRAKRGMPLEDICLIGQNICRIFTYLHQQQVVFCDLSANNVMISFEGHMFLIDFGIAQLMGEARPSMLLGLGTRGFAAPELYPHAQYGLSPATDIYSLGALLHYACTGKDPTHCSDPFAFPSLPGRVPPDLGTLIWAMLDSEPGERPTLLEVRRVLDAQRFLYA